MHISEYLTRLRVSLILYEFTAKVKQISAPQSININKTLNNLIKIGGNLFHRCFYDSYISLSVLLCCWFCCCCCCLVTLSTLNYCGRLPVLLRLLLVLATLLSLETIHICTYIHEYSIYVCTCE